MVVSDRHQRFDDRRNISCRLLVFDAVKPTSPQVELQMQKDSMFIELAQELTGKHDTQTVERVKHDVLSYLSKTMEQYPTREEFAREKHRYIDKEQGVIWESKMENGNMSIYAVAPYTNKTGAADSK